MKEIENEKLYNISGGSKIALGFLIAAGITFLIGVIDGYVRPLRCN